MTYPDTIALPQHIHDEIIAHAQAGALEEVCGILSGRDGVATELVRARNEAANPVMDYWVDGQTLLKQFDFEERGEAMIAIYHSHPVDEPYPSATDAANAFYPDAVYLICSLLRPEQPRIRGWKLIQEDLAERPAQLQAVRGNPNFWAQHQHREHEDAYDLVTVEEGGRERWQRVRVVEVIVLVDEQD
ncbi:MAG TPA: M67 family metallopeptidase [Anaerolineae bacterium]|nr:M67 family metallopeptidase [Anaerolineae bacterium]